MSEPDDAQVVEEFEGIEALEVQMVGGDLAVTTSSGAARLEYEVTQGPPLEHEVIGRVLRVVHRPDRLSGLTHSPRAIVRIGVPERVPVTLRTVSADAFLAGDITNASVATVSGRVTVSGLSGESSLHSVSGDIEAEGVTGDITTNTVSGSITVAAADVTSVTCRSVSGDITLDLATTATTNCTSVSGDVTIGIAGEVSFDLDVTTLSGRLGTTFPSTGLDASRRRLRGAVGDGGPEVTIRTTSGDVAILRRDVAEAMAVAE